MTRSIVALAVLACAMAAPAAAQVDRPAPRPPQPTERVFISVDGIYQTGTEDFDDAASFSLNAETANFATAYEVKPGPAFSVAGSGLVTRGLAVGVGVTRFQRETPAGLTASLPHPFFFNRPRSLSGDVGSLNREELAVHVQARAVFPSPGRLQAMVFGGPSFFTVKQDVLTELGYTEAYPYDTVTLAPGQITEVSTSKTGFNVGADVGFFFTRQLGIGGTVQYAGATIEVESAGGDTIDVKIGGIQVGGGLRLRF
jgi:hypothetical protein